jgi:glutathione S-transferase
VQQFFELLNERLRGREFIASEAFGIVDITAVVVVDFARVVKLKPGDNLPELLRWRAAMAQRPAMSV